VLRITPSYSLPYIFFRPHAPNALSTFRSGSLSRLIDRPFFSANF
jgi:hypothetical protein